MIDEQGEMVGVMTTQEALVMARERGLDLIEVSPKAAPPVAKILSFDKYRYQQEKAITKARKRQKRIEVKGIRISVRIGQHDLEFKVRQADKFLERGNKVKVEMFLRGRERANLSYAFEMMKKFLETVTAAHQLEQPPKKLGHIISAILSPK